MNDVYTLFNRCRTTSKIIIYIQISNFDIDPREKKKNDDEMNHLKCFFLLIQPNFNLKSNTQWCYFHSILTGCPIKLWQNSLFYQKKKSMTNKTKQTHTHIYNWWSFNEVIQFMRVCHWIIKWSSSSLWFVLIPSLISLSHLFSSFFFQSDTGDFFLLHTKEQ